jgi:NADP-dependent 3-hydroxy acid dehydrogenase YdfG
VPAALKKNADIADWFYLPSWRRADCSVPAEMRPESWLAFADCEGSGATLVEQLEALGMNVAIVEAGPIFRRSGERRYVINPENPADYRAVLEQLAEQKFLPTQILHAWSLPPRPHTTDSDSFTEIRRKGFDSLLFLAQAVGECRITRSMQISVITDQAHDVIGTEVGRPETALILGPCRVIPLEYPNLRCRNLDVAVGPQGADVSWVKSILTELTQASTDPIVAFRGGHRWLPGVEQVRLKAAVAPPPVLRRGGVYLITGGLGTIGLEIAEYLASTVQARLILVGRSTFPPPEKWDSLTDAREARVARRLSSMRSMGADIMVVSADVSDLSRMRAVHAEAERRFGPINGVVHSAGVLGDGAIQNKSIGDVEHVLSAKVRGTLVLKQLFESVELDFWVLFSSLSARRPTFGQAAYSAANNFLDALASKPSNRHRAACCISWDVWHRDGMAYDAQAPLVLRSIRTADFDRRGISPVEGVEVFRRILNSGLRHVLVSTSNYLAAAPTDDRGLPTIYLDSLTAKARSELRHGRPALESSYVAAGSETETMLVRMWEELLGIDGIGIDDNFFSLGGDSLIGTQLTTRIKADFAVKLPIRAVYDDPTIRRMAVAVELALINEAAPARLSGLLHQLG